MHPVYAHPFRSARQRRRRQLTMDISMLSQGRFGEPKPRPSGLSDLVGGDAGGDGDGGDGRTPSDKVCDYAP